MAAKPKIPRHGTKGYQVVAFQRRVHGLASSLMLGAPEERTNASRLSWPVSALSGKAATRGSSPDKGQPERDNVATPSGVTHGDYVSEAIRTLGSDRFAGARLIIQIRTLVSEKKTDQVREMLADALGGSRSDVEVQALLMAGAEAYRDVGQVWDKLSDLFLEGVRDCPKRVEERKQWISHRKAAAQ